MIPAERAAVVSVFALAIGLVMGASQGISHSRHVAAHEYELARDAVSLAAEAAWRVCRYAGCVP